MVREGGGNTFIPLARSLLGWAVLYGVAIYLYNRYHPYVAEFLIFRLQIVPSVWLIEWTLPGMQILASTTSIQCPQLQLDILRGCDGVEAWLMLMTALVVFPAPWKRRCMGMLYGTLLVMGLNMVRITSLFHIALKQPGWFDLAHTVIWQGILLLLIMAFILAWMQPGQTMAPAQDKKT